MMDEEFVRRREWVTRAEFLDMVGAASLIPGPSSTEVALYIGFRRAGYWGLILAGLGFIVPAALMVCAIAAAYVRFGSLPVFASAMSGVKPVVVAIIAQAVWLLGVKAAEGWTRRLIVVGSAGLSFLGLSSLPILIGAGALLAGRVLWTERSVESSKPLARVLFAVGVVASVPAIAQLLWSRGAAPGPVPLFLYFSKLGSVLYGSGYVLLSFLQHDLVQGLHWLPKGQLLDATAVGQFTPGPVFTTATFIGYVLSGPLGALLATLGIFLPSFAFVAISGKGLGALRAAPISAAFLDGVNSAAVGLMGVVAIILARESLTGPQAVVLALGSLFCLMKYKTNSAWLIALGAVVGGWSA